MWTWVDANSFYTKQKAEGLKESNNPMPKYQRPYFTILLAATYLTVIFIPSCTIQCSTNQLEC